MRKNSSKLNMVKKLAAELGLTLNDAELKEKMQQAEIQDKDIKFILILEKQHADYIEWKAVHHNVSKAEVVRASLLEMMEEDTEYAQAIMLEDNK